MVGIGGIGMSALAQLFKHQGKSVSGSDREESPVTSMLAEKGIRVWIGHDHTFDRFDKLTASKLNAGYNIPADTELLIYSDAVPAGNSERVRAREMGIPQTSYFEALGEVSKSARTIAVAGTHGKTTTTGMLAAILKAADKEPTAIVGSIVKDFGSNFLAGKPDLFIVEACEYRDHLLELSPEILVITNIELDHTDFFPSLSALQATFRAAVEKVPTHGAVVTDPNDPAIVQVLGKVSARIVDLTKETVPALKLIGEFNRMNARAAAAAARAAFPNIMQGTIDRALMEFKGSWRRFEYKGETPKGALVYDDYAHHPTAVVKTIEAAREKYPDKEITIVFHPHLYSRTKDFFSGFVEALAQADYIILAPIYAAREKDTGEISSDMLAEAIAKKNRNVLSLHTFDEIRKELLDSAKEKDLIITMGAGDIYKVAEQIVD